MLLLLIIFITLISFTSSEQTEFKYSFLDKNGADYFKEHQNSTYDLQIQGTRIQ